MSSTWIAPHGVSVPSARTFGRLFFAGYCALMAWEIWARTITAWVVGGPLEPPGLIISLVQHWTGYVLPLSTTTFLHYMVGIFGYPLAYFIISRHLKRWSLILDALVWVIFTLFLAYGLFRGSDTTSMGVFWVVVTLITATRFVNPSHKIAESLSWGSFTWFNALGIMAPLAGLPFLLLEWGGALSFMSYVGHILFGFIIAYLFETWEKQAEA